MEREGTLFSQVEDLLMINRNTSLRRLPLPKKVNCQVCHREILRIDALSDEGEEYILWFCGFDCYHTWRQTDKNRQ